MCKHAIVIYCLLSQPSLIPNFFTCSHASSLALFPIESLHKVTFEERTATRTGHFILKQSTREKHLTSGYCPSLKKQCFPQFLDDFSGPFNVVRLLLQCLFFPSLFTSFVWVTSRMLRQQGTLLKRTTFCTFTLKNPIKQNYHVKGSQNLHTLDWKCFLRFFLLFSLFCSFVFFLLASRCQKKKYVFDCFCGLDYSVIILIQTLF